MQFLDKKEEHYYKNRVHKVLAHSYSLYFILFLFGIILDFVLRIKFFSGPIMISLGILFLSLGTFLIFWAQHTSHHLKKESITHHIFYQGPYKYTRSPTHLGLFLLMLGFGVMANAFFVILFSFIAFVVSKLIFLDKEESILAEKYGSHYLEYKKRVKF